ncbi:MAG: hypothetical protein ACPMAQ_01260 [Phycisphaerae bacterium]
MRTHRHISWALTAVAVMNTYCRHSHGWDTHNYGAHYQAAQTETDQAPESSGVIASRLSADVYWTNNDSGNPARLWVFRLTAADEAVGIAKNLGYVDPAGASNVDWEDIAAGPGNMIYVFDGGDNPPCDRANKRVYRFAEPAIDPNGSPVAMSVACSSIRFEYPDSTNPALPADANDERFDCESFAVHPVSGDLYLVTKRNNAGASVSRVYKLPAAGLTWGSNAVYVVQLIADISSKVPSFPTGMDIDRDGRRLVVRNYSTAYEFTLPAGRPFDEIFQATPVAIDLSGEPQGEAICYHASGGDLITTSESGASGYHSAPVYRVPWLLANAQASNVTTLSATISWQTRNLLGATVDYGRTTAYGSSISDPAPLTQHAIQIAGLSPQTQYYFRVISGTLTYPPPSRAGDVSFETSPTPADDFDGDGDVDLDDFSYFQGCFNGPNRPIASGCDRMDFDADHDVDLADFGIFQGCFNGPNRPPVCG